MAKFNKIGDVMVTYLNCVVLHERSRKIEYVFNNRVDPIVNDYSKDTKYNRNYIRNVFSIMSRYGKLTGKELTVYRFGD